MMNEKKEVNSSIGCNVTECKYNNQGDFYVDSKHENKGTENSHNARKKVSKAHQKSVGECVNVGDNSAYDIAVGMGVDVFKR